MQPGRRFLLSRSSVVCTIGVLLAAAAAVMASPRGASPPSCILELTARDASGNAVQQTIAYALDRPGLILAPLSATTRLRPRWERLQVLGDPSIGGTGADGKSAYVTEVLLQDPARDLVLLRAPGLDACDASLNGTTAGDGGAASSAPYSWREGEPLIGIRDRDGYRPRVFQARLDKTISTGSGRDLLRIRIPDGGGAGAGYLLDDHQRLVGAILPPPPGGDRQFACAVPIDSRELDAAASTPGRPILDALGAPPEAAFARTPVGLWTTALLLTRDDQTDQALAVLDELGRLAGETDLLFMERGVRRFRIGRTDAAIQDFARAAELNPRRHLAQFDLGVAQGAAGHYAQAIDAFSRALEIDPRHAQTRYQLAIALLATHQPARAREESLRLESLDPALAADLQAVLQSITAP